MKRPVAVYTRRITVPGVKYGEKAASDFNKLWGFEDGSCNEYVGDKLVAKEPYPEGFEEANAKIWRAHVVTIEVSIYKNGTKTFRVLP